jgi:hypothetical protein
VAARENLVNKIEATLMAKFDKKISLWRVGQSANKM